MSIRARITTAIVFFALALSMFPVSCHFLATDVGWRYGVGAAAALLCAVLLAVSCALAAWTTTGIAAKGESE